MAEKSDQKKLERQYKTVGESLRLVQEVANEPTLPAASCKYTSPSATLQVLGLSNRESDSDSATIDLREPRSESTQTP